MMCRLFTPPARPLATRKHTMPAGIGLSTLLILLLLLTACIATAVLHAAGFALFRRAGVATAYSAALMSGNRNMGLMLVITAGTAGEAFSLYVAIAQLPMYFAPLVLGPFLRRSRRHAASGPTPIRLCPRTWSSSSTVMFRSPQSTQGCSRRCPTR